mmetsp:Transcript_61846/g.162451  ORF Transcript_61846/g.162451 Transcript_61846/m.162451 type:complete len:473 (-) Transcript_61846:1927-3345(-)
MVERVHQLHHLADVSDQGHAAVHRPPAQKVAGGGGAGVPRRGRREDHFDGLLLDRVRDVRLLLGDCVVQHRDVHRFALAGDLLALEVGVRAGGGVQRVSHLGEQRDVGPEDPLVVLRAQRDQDAGGAAHAAGAHRELQAARDHGLQEGLLRVLAEAGDLARALHLHAGVRVGAAEAQEGEHGDLARDEVEVHDVDLRGLHVLAEHHARRELDEVHVQGLGDEGDRARRAHVALDDLHAAHGAAAALLRQELHVEGARDVQRLAQLRGDVHHPTVRLQAQRLGGQQERGVAAVAAGVLHMLRDGVVDHLAVAADAVELDLPGTAVVLADHHGVLLLDHRGAAQEAAELRLVVDDAHGGTGEHVGRAHEHGEADGVGEVQGVLELHELGPLRLVDVHIVAERGELGAVLGHVDVGGRGAEDRHSVPGQHGREVVRRLAADGDDHARGVLEGADLQHGLQGQLLEVEAVALVVVR